MSVKKQVATLFAVVTVLFLSTMGLTRMVVKGTRAKPTIHYIPPEVIFQGEPAKKRIEWDLAGTWHVNRFSTEEKPGKLGRWEGTWNILPKDDHGFWSDESNKKPVWIICDRRGDIIIFGTINDPERKLFSINEQSFGFLMMTGDDGEMYMAVRSD